MTGRHASRRTTPASSWPRRLGLSVAAVAVLGAIGLGTVSVLQSTGTCRGVLPVTVTADPSIAPTLAELAATYGDATPHVGTMCVEMAVRAAPGAEVGPTVGQADSPDLWVPKSSMFTHGADAELLGDPTSVAVSPLVVVLPEAVATQLGWPDVEFSWQTVMQDGQATLADPLGTDEGLASLVAVRAALADQLEQAQLVQLMTQVSRLVVPTTETAFEAVADGTSTAAFTATEQAVVAHNVAVSQAPVVALYPTEGTLSFDYPAFTIRGAGSDADDVSVAVADFVAFLGTPGPQETLRSAGFRSPDGTADDDAGVVDGIQPAMPPLLTPPDPAAVSELARQWAALTLQTRMLAVIDISGSMNEPVEGGGTRMELTRDAALNAMRLFPPTSSIGLWAFSILQDPPRDHIELVDIGPISEPLGSGQTRQEALVAALQSLPERAEGGTGLYDTVLAAFQEVRANYQAGKVNSVVLLTDGRNEDDPDGIDLATLVNTLTAQFDPARPVPVITIGMGPEADMEALSQISTATGTTAYQAEDPRDVESVFVQAMIERQCRPNC